MSNTKILFIAYQFPPRGGPGVQRSKRFVQHLPEFGVDPIVLTVEPEEYAKAGELMDPTLLKDIPASTRIIRTKSYIPFTFIRILTKLRIFRLVWYFGYPWFYERMARWPKEVFPQASSIIEQEKISVVYTSSGPFCSLFLGRKLQEKTGVKWIADLRDPFTDAYAWLFPSKFHWLFARKMEASLLAKADILIVNTNEVKKLFLKRGIGTEDSIRVITNGY